MVKAMTRARKEQVCLDETPYYHCICRCVRRAFLCGDDKFTGKNFDYRKPWLVDKIHLLSSIFTIDICAYAIMSNHYHLVLKVDKDKAESLSDLEVVYRWKQLFNGHVLVDRWLTKKNITQAETDKALALILIWRERLFDLGWYMRCLNESIISRGNPGPLSSIIMHCFLFLSLFTLIQTLPLHHLKALSKQFPNISNKSNSSP